MRVFASSKAPSPYSTLVDLREWCFDRGGELLDLVIHNGLNAFDSKRWGGYQNQSKAQQPCCSEARPSCIAFAGAISQNTTAVVATSTVAPAASVTEP